MKYLGICQVFLYVLVPMLYAGWVWYNLDAFIKRSKI